jgi:hypothetical protein
VADATCLADGVRFDDYARRFGGDRDQYSDTIGRMTSLG